MQTDFFNDLLDEQAREFLQAAQRDFATIAKLNNVIAHKNEHVLVDNIILDISSFDKEALQILYEDINNYQNPDIKETLITQLKQERPNFKPRIEATQFLQYVAYGQQDEAEALLQVDPSFAQALLKADNIEFTDYSGRTFTCTAYEYAWWAKDTHMQRMLEKYIRIDEETRQFILQQVQEIEKNIAPEPAAGFFEPPRPKGLHYTTRDSQGEIMHHQEAHFDLLPLKRALAKYINEYNSNPDKSAENKEMLNKIWIEEVGGEQKQVPSHIAHEYCHPERSFYQIIRDKSLLDAANPEHLKRCLKFRLPSDNDDFSLPSESQNGLWFTSMEYS
jgi:hypothetical protein